MKVTLKSISKLINKYKTELIAEAKRTGIVERFGEKEGRTLEDALTELERADTTGDNYVDRRVAREAVRQFHIWAMNYEL